MPDISQDWQSGSCFDRAQLVGEHPVAGGRLKFQSSRLKGGGGGSKILMARVRSIPRHQAILADKNAEGLTSSLVPRMQPATNLSKGGLQMAL